MALALAFALLAQEEPPATDLRLYSSLACELREVSVEWQGQALGTVGLASPWRFVEYMRIDFQFTPHTGRPLDVLILGAAVTAGVRVFEGAALSAGVAWRGYAGDVRGSALALTLSFGWRF